MTRAVLNVVAVALKFTQFTQMCVYLIKQCYEIVVSLHAFDIFLSSLLKCKNESSYLKL